MHISVSHSLCENWCSQCSINCSHHFGMSNCLLFWPLSCPLKVCCVMCYNPFLLWRKTVMFLELEMWWCVELWCCWHRKMCFLKALTELALWNKLMAYIPFFLCFCFDLWYGHFPNFLSTFPLTFSESASIRKSICKEITNQTYRLVYCKHNHKNNKHWRLLWMQIQHITLK